MTKQAALTPLAEDSSGTIVPPRRAANSAEPGVSVGRGTDATHAHAGEAATDRSGPDEVAAESGAVSTPPVPVTARRRGSGRWFPALCGLVALIAAALALAAPSLRPAIARMADTWLGTGNVVSRVVAPSPEADASWRMAREQAMQALDGRLAEYTARIDRLSAAQQATNADVSRAVATLQADHAASDTLVRAVDDLSRQTKELRSATTALDWRSRAVGLLTLSLRLRRDVDAGQPIGRDAAALAATGPYPIAVDRALQQLRRVGDGVPTMRDLADDFDRVMARVVARSNTASSWTERGWATVSGLFGGGVPSDDARLVAHLRALAADGRFSEAADEIMASDDADLGAEWVARVRTRASAVVAAQVLLNHALAAYDAAYAAPVGDAAGKPTQ